jgi:hypothetical protein
VCVRPLRSCRIIRRHPSIHPSLSSTTCLGTFLKYRQRGIYLHIHTLRAITSTRCPTLPYPSAATLTSATTCLPPIQSTPASASWLTDLGMPGLSPAKRSGEHLSLHKGSEPFPDMPSIQSFHLPLQLAVLSSPSKTLPPPLTANQPLHLAQLRSPTGLWRGRVVFSVPDQDGGTGCAGFL